MTTMSPPPPPPPPVIEDRPSTSSRPTFIEQWLEKEKEKSPTTNKINKREFLEKQCLFPGYIPAAAMCDIKPMLGLISHHVEESDGGIMDSTQRTALDDVRKIASLCATYKSRAVMNHKEVQYKRAIILKEKKRLEEQSIEPASENADSSKKSESIPLPAKPPYHPEFTPLSLRENYIMAKIQGANYNVCIANAVCPDRTKRLLTCWESLDPQWVKMIQQQGMDEFVCLEEKAAVERCIGMGVQRVMKDLLG